MGVESLTPPCANIYPMAITPYRRHLRTCEHQHRGQNFTLCACPIWGDGTLGGKRWRRSLKTSDWEQALRCIRTLTLTAPSDQPKSKALQQIAAEYLAECSARNVRESTIKSYRRTLATLPDVRLSQITTATISEWRMFRDVAPSTQRKELEHLRFFFAWCRKRKLLAENPLEGIAPPRVDQVPTMPYTQEQVEALLAACAQIASDNPEETPYIRRRARAFLLLLLYSGLRRSDAAVLRRSALNADGYLFLRMEKTRQPLKVQLPPDVARELRALPAENPDYFFWTGVSKPSTVAGNLWRTIKRVGAIANVDATTHRFRDTFACRLLEHGHDIRTVQKLLGHTSVRTTEKHYAPWVQSHQKLLDSATATLDFLSPGKPLVSLKNKGLRNAK